MTGADDTLAASLPTTGDTPSLAGYREAELLGRGGMGEVVLATDQRIGREVAIKRMRGEPTEEMTARFLREATIQARLDHPSIVPVHELGRDTQGRPYFTMKRLTGRTLLEVLAKRSESQQRLLRALADVCRAIDRAHASDIIHRDLKPANVMLGDYGEVYVLDWGVARIIGESDDRSGDALAADGKTEAGALLGTPGYMSPEQARGETVTPATDSYALGCILFEILADEPLHPRGLEGIAATLTTPTRAPSEHREVPPELDALCVDALAEDPARRPGARAIADRIQAYLDGDRDVERRRALAAELVVQARAALATDRGAAMRAAGRALALDPESADAGALVSSLMLTPPDPLPAELDAHLAGFDTVFERRQWGLVALLYTAVLAFFPLLVWIGIRDPWPIVVAVALFAGATGVAARWWRAGTPNIIAFCVVAIIPMMFVSRLWGVFVVVPSMLVVHMVGYLSYPAAMRRPLLTIAIIMSGLVVPIVLEATGVIAPTWEVANDSIVMHSRTLALGGGAATAVTLVAAHVMIMIAAGAFAWLLASTRRNALRTVEIQAWHLRKLLPQS